MIGCKANWNNNFDWAVTKNEKGNNLKINILQKWNYLIQESDWSSQGQL